MKILLLSFTFFNIFCILFLLLANVVLSRSNTMSVSILVQEVKAQFFFLLPLMAAMAANVKIEGYTTALNFSFNSGSFSIQLIAIIFFFLSLLSIFSSFRSEKLNFPEFFVVMLIGFIASLMVVNANSLLSLFIVVEIFALCSIVLVSFNKHSPFSNEAGLKYFISSAVFSSIFLLGTGLIYFCYGTINFDELLCIGVGKLEAMDSTVRLFSEIGMLMITAWLFFKLASAPFYSWATDAYDGAPTATTIFLSTSPKFIFINFLIKWTKIYFTLSLIDRIDGYSVLIFCGIISCICGFFSALIQKKLKKVFIYSSVGQIGYIVAVSFLSTDEASTIVIVFSILYILTSIIMWNIYAILIGCEHIINRNRKKPLSPLNLTSINNLYEKNKIFGILVAILFFSMSGIPPMLSFYGKFEIFAAMINSNLYVIVILMIIVSSLSSFYYMELVRGGFFKSELDAIKKRDDYRFVVADDEIINGLHLLNCYLICFVVLGYWCPDIIIDCAIIIVNKYGL